MFKNIKWKGWDIVLPNDINMLVSFLNTKLRDDDMSLEHLLEINDINLNEFMTRLDRNGYFFDENNNMLFEVQMKKENAYQLVEYIKQRTCTF